MTFRCAQQDGNVLEILVPLARLCVFGSTVFCTLDFSSFQECQKPFKATTGGT